MRRPEFTVIAGPNGAGKSSLHPYYINTPSFDGDKLAMQLREAHPDWSEQWITNTVAYELEKQKKEALAHSLEVKNKNTQSYIFGCKIGCLFCNYLVIR